MNVLLVSPRNPGEISPGLEGAADKFADVLRNDGYHIESCTDLKVRFSFSSIPVARLRTGVPVVTCWELKGRKLAEIFRSVSF